MSKRIRDDCHRSHIPPKRPRKTPAIIDRLSYLSDEILLHILSFLPISSLLDCQRLSRQFHALAGDSELWKRQYYTRWVRPRTRRLRKGERSNFVRPQPSYSPRVSTWLDHSHLGGGANTTNWKRQYRLRHNWSRGTCQVSEVVFSQPTHSPLLVEFFAGYVFTADSEYGLRAWDAGNPQSCLADVSFSGLGSHLMMIPSALAVTRCPRENAIRVVVGFESGVFGLYRMDTNEPRLEELSFDLGTPNGPITALACSLPFLLVIAEHNTLSLYKFAAETQCPISPEPTSEAYLLTSLKTDRILAPMSLSLRVTSVDIISSIVYSFFHIGCGWSLGIQELHFNKKGEQLDSRLTTTVDSQYRVPSYSLNTSRSEAGYGAALNAPFILHQEPPTSVSYSHPYLLTSHADNTLTAYLVFSGIKTLYVKGGRRLWGHTSSVGAVQVSDRGKAISVSTRGDEIRIWELEALISTIGAPKVLKEESIQIIPGNQESRKHEGVGLVSVASTREIIGSRLIATSASQPNPDMRGCIGFDDKRVLLLRENRRGGQTIELYDFT